MGRLGERVKEQNQAGERAVHLGSMRVVVDNAAALLKSGLHRFLCFLLTYSSHVAVGRSTALNPIAISE